MRLANIQGRAHLVSADGSTAVDLFKVSDGRFGPDLRSVYDSWDAARSFVAQASIDIATQGIPVQRDLLEAPSPEPRQVFAIGLNYTDHADESNLDLPDAPLVFTKFVSCFAGPDTTLVLPSTTVDWEAELVVVIGRPAEQVTEDQAWEHVAGVPH